MRARTETPGSHSSTRSIRWKRTRLSLAPDRDRVGERQVLGVRERDVELLEAVALGVGRRPLPSSRIRGRPLRSLTTSTSVQRMRWLMPVPNAFRTASLAAKRAARCS